MSKIIDEFINIEDEFFILDHENKTARMILEFDNPNEIFDLNAVTKKPILNDNFLSWIKQAFDYAPAKYKIDLDIRFNVFKEYDSDSLKDIFKKNILLDSKKNLKRTNFKNKIAISLFIIGIIFFAIMMILSNLWKEEKIIKDIVCYILDIATTVTIWEALTILIIENKEKRDLNKNIVKRFGSIEFNLK